ncbi:Orotate phosphoribosyltransferase [Dissostichus eleginoides]|uniref:Orotate phosphoribosyltransferase n=1 Tax=Dissostichus eleginoides TaxID=100907 RepID=A0AAD9F039_DISEL|nr:Orotate phosphoribosyltransferase [Dissostichus eleginoides]
MTSALLSSSCFFFSCLLLGGGGVLARLGGIVCPGLSGRSLGLTTPLGMPLHGSLLRTDEAMEEVEKLSRELTEVQRLNISGVS